MNSHMTILYYFIGCCLLLLSSSNYAAYSNKTFITPIKLSPQLTPIQTNKVILGNTLFEDKNLSNNKELSCSSCHIMSKSYSDNLPFSKNNIGKNTQYNTPSVEYSIYNYYFSWTGQFYNLQDHISAIMSNNKIMNRNWDELVQQLNNDKTYQQLFSAAKYDSISQHAINDAIINYIKSLAKQSRFDLFLLGDKSKLSKKEIAGFNLFKSSGCVSCHQGTNLGGNVRQKFGLMKSYFNNNKIKQRDLGFFNITKNEDDFNFFRVPSLRNVTNTAPYFHDASADNIEEAIKIMFSYQLGIKASEQDILSIKSFLESLEPIK